MMAILPEFLLFSFWASYGGNTPTLTCTKHITIRSSNCCIHTIRHIFAGTSRGPCGLSPISHPCPPFSHDYLQISYPCAPPSHGLSPIAHPCPPFSHDYLQISHHRITLLDYIHAAMTRTLKNRHMLIASDLARPLAFKFGEPKCF